MVLERKVDPGEKLHTTGIIVKEAAEQTWLRHAPADCLHRVEQVCGSTRPAPRSLALRVRPTTTSSTTDTPRLMRWLAAELVCHGVTCAWAPRSPAPSPAGVAGACPAWAARATSWAPTARSRVAITAGLGRVHDFLYGVEYEFPGMTLPEPGALHCFVSKRFAPGYIGWVAQNSTGVQAGLALRQTPRRPRAPDIDGFRSACAICCNSGRRDARRHPGRADSVRRASRAHRRPRGDADWRCGRGGFCR